MKRPEIRSDGILAHGAGLKLEPMERIELPRLTFESIVESLTDLNRKSGINWVEKWMGVLMQILQITQVKVDSI